MDSSGLIRSQRQSIIDGDTDTAVDLAREAVRVGADLQACIHDGYVAGIREAPP